jgi:hypothetical protein
MLLAVDRQGEVSLQRGWHRRAVGLGATAVGLDESGHGAAVLRLGCRVNGGARARFLRQAPAGISPQGSELRPPGAVPGNGWTGAKDRRMSAQAARAAAVGDAILCG